ncbi:hypothetical protein SISSUDRAFT_1062049 [Sistotremastrum suecicum HHB10207 ss-3]|uniref:Inositol hexakisphosphate and diphosphoinositol-pentakisphosphate kinase n=1 Tax=Sistotremastrum suecicum HHB10207 ss-3 TaxID=1314776 RepID=A0A166DAT6_9AGAM|nr:hypothetical protein SISSUDRAFT_1062049 [Sistotremastrum suecicum HHB10207 ss-3]
MPAATERPTRHTTALFSSPPKPRSSSSYTSRSFSPSPWSSDTNLASLGSSGFSPIVLGVCAMDIKARSKAMREILTRMVERSRGGIEVKIFGDKVIFDEDVENWPRCDVLICFFSTDFPLDKAVSYVKLRQPKCVNDLPTQALLWDRRVVGQILDHLKVPTPPRIEVSRDGGPRLDAELADIMKERIGFELRVDSHIPQLMLREDGDAIIVDGKVMEKPFVEKPVSGEDHNVYIYFKGGGGRRLFRKVGNKSSELDENLNHPRVDGSYIYETFIDVDNSEDIKVYTIGPDYTHAETRKSPVVDGVVRRNTDGKEIRFITHLTEDEKAWAAKICNGFGQHVCGFDLLRCENGSKSMVIDVNGWSFVKGNDYYYDKAAEVLGELCHSVVRHLPSSIDAKMEEASSWVLKANVTVFRHADRTPKQKIKYNFPVDLPWTQPFIALLNGSTEEIIVRERDQLILIGEAVEKAKSLGAGPEDMIKLTQLNKALKSKIDLPGTKAQLKPGLEKEKKGLGKDRKLVKLQLVFKWGGEFTHAARYQSRDLGENMKKDISIMNKDVLNNVKIFTSSERRVTASAEIFAAALLDSGSAAHSSFPPSSSNITPVSGSTSEFSSIPTSTSVTPSQSTSNSNSILHPRSSIISQSSSNANLTNSLSAEKVHLIIRKDLLDDSNAAKDLMDDVKKRLKILLRPGEPEKRPELTWPKSMNKEPVEVVKEVIELLTSFREIMRKNFESLDVDKIQERWCCGDEPWLFRERWEKLFEDFCDVKQEKFDPSRVSELYDTIKYCALHHRTFLFSIFNEHGGVLKPNKIRTSPDRKLHELYARAKALFDLVAPQEYGIETWEKEEIGILTSLPLLRKVVEDLEAARSGGGSSLTLYFTKESHIHTLVNLVLLSGLPIANPRIPELDYASHITFELYERNGGRGNTDKEYSIKLSLSEGAHSSNVLDSALDARHSLNVQQRRNLTQHLPYKTVVEKLSKHFNRVSELEDSGSESEPEAIEVPVLHSSSSADGI